MLLNMEVLFIHQNNIGRTVAGQTRVGAPSSPGSSSQSWPARHGGSTFRNTFKEESLLHIKTEGDPYWMRPKYQDVESVLAEQVFN